MKIGFVSENGLSGKVPQSFPNARTEYGWAYNLDADMFPLNQAASIPSNMDLLIFIIPKKIQPNNDESIVAFLKTKAKKVAVMQEGSFWNFQDLDLTRQIWYSNEYASSDYIFCHNESDAKYYRGIYPNIPVMILRTAMIEYTLSSVTKSSSENTMIGGNFCSWYGGFDSYIVAQEFKTDIYAPAMGRKKDGEEQLLNILPYMNWTGWMEELSKYKYAVHLMRTFGAGTFAMNCGYWGIPCVGYKGLDTQEYIHPHTSVDVGDIEAARLIAKKLRDDSYFYDLCSQTALDRIDRYSNKNKWLADFVERFNQLEN